MKHAITCLALKAVVMNALVVMHVSAAAQADPYANPPSPAFAGQTGASAPALTSSYQVEVLATGLARPRSLAGLARWQSAGG